MYLHAVFEAHLLICMSCTSQVCSAGGFTTCKDSKELEGFDRNCCITKA